MIIAFRTELAEEDALLVNVAHKGHLLADLEARMTEARGFSIATLNLDHVVKMRRDPAFHDAYAQHSHITADGNPIVWLHRLAGRPIELVTGSDLILPLMQLAARLEVPVGFLGSTEETLAKAAAQLEATCPGLRIVARISPPLGFDPNSDTAKAALTSLQKAGVRLCLLALGAPKQECLAARGITLLPETGFVSVGAGLDFIAGHQKRAPVWMRRIAMEWAWRMFSNPRRLTRRYVQSALVLPKLVWDAYNQKIRIT